MNPNMDPLGHIAVSSCMARNELKSFQRHLHQRALANYFRSRVSADREVLTQKVKIMTKLPARNPKIFNFVVQSKLWAVAMDPHPEAAYVRTMPQNLAYRKICGQYFKCI